jgi:membrane-bound metal-dependent hydrolase YbcI (DUF457 family)
VPAIAGDASTLACLAAGAAGGLLPDTDVSTSEASRQLRRAWWLLVAVIAATFAADALLGLDLGTQTVAFARTAGVYQVAGAAVVVAVLACGRASGHRGFSHSLVAAALFFAGVYLAVPEIALALTVGYCSHLVIDLFNKMPERLFWPVARGQSFGLCKSGGVVDGALLVLAVVAVVALLAGWL